MVLFFARSVWKLWLKRHSGGVDLKVIAPMAPFPLARHGSAVCLMAVRSLCKNVW